MKFRLVCKKWNQVSSEFHCLPIIVGYSTPILPRGKVPHIKIITPDSFLEAEDSFLEAEDSFLEAEDSIRMVDDLLMQILPTLDSNTKVVLCDFDIKFTPCISSLGPSLKRLMLTYSNTFNSRIVDLRSLPNPGIYLEDMCNFGEFQDIIPSTAIQEFSIKSVCKNPYIDARFCKQLSSLKIKMLWKTEHIVIRITCNPSEKVASEQVQSLIVRMKNDNFVTVWLPWHTYRLEILLYKFEPIFFEVHPAYRHSLLFTYSSNGELKGFEDTNLKRINK